jgi:peptide chain release factor
MTGILLHLSAGQGPRECEWVVEQLAQAFGREARAEGLCCEPVEPLKGPCASSILRISGASADLFAAARTGTIRWTGTSPFRPSHKRRNWFVGVQLISETGNCPELRDEDICYQTLRASGPGGQHVNKTDSAVRATHVPTGLTTLSQDQRSQFANRKIARLKLAMLLEQRRMREAAGGKRILWQQNQDLERGNAVRSYGGTKFEPI